jgi:hypothetical protein
MTVNPAHPWGNEPYKPPHLSMEQPRVPGVWIWYVIYCVLMALLYLICLAVSIVLIAFADEIAAGDPEMDATECRITGAILCMVSLPLMVLFGVAPLLPKKKFAWIWGLITIAIGMTSCCCLPVSIPLLIFWIKSDTKAFFHTM